MRDRMSTPPPPIAVDGVRIARAPERAVLSARVQAEGLSLPGRDVDRGRSTIRGWARHQRRSVPAAPPDPGHEGAAAADHRGARAAGRGRGAGDGHPRHLEPPLHPPPPPLDTAEHLADVGLGAFPAQKSVVRSDELPLGPVPRVINALDTAEAPSGL